MTVAVDSLPWAALRLKDFPVPWQDLRALADAAVESACIREELIARGRAALDVQVGSDTYDASDLTDLGVVAVLALAADRLNDDARSQAAEFLLTALKRAAEAGDDFLEEAAERATGRLGPVIIEPLLRLIESERCRLHCWFAAFMLLCVAEDADPATQQNVARFCRRAIRECPDRFELISLAMGPAWVLLALNDRESLPLIKAVYEQSRDRELAFVIQHLETGQGLRAPHAWHVPVEEWLPDTLEAFREACAAERRARESAASPQPADPENDPDDEANYATDWRQLPSQWSRPLDGPQPENHVPILRDEPKVSRNDPCPCGSGKKYKKCCGR